MRILFILFVLIGGLVLYLFVKSDIININETYTLPQNSFVTIGKVNYTIYDKEGRPVYKGRQLIHKLIEGGYTITGNDIEAKIIPA